MPQPLLRLPPRQTQWGPDRSGSWYRWYLLLLATAPPPSPAERNATLERTDSGHTSLATTALVFARTSLHRWLNFLHDGGFLFRYRAPGPCRRPGPPVEERKGGGNPKPVVARSLLSLVLPSWLTNASPVTHRSREAGPCWLQRDPGVSGRIGL